MATGNVYRRCEEEPSFYPACMKQEAADNGGSSIAVVQCRFYDLAGAKATLFSDAGKAASLDAGQVKRLG